MVLVRIVGKVHEDHRGGDAADHRLDPHDQLPAERHLGVGIPAPDDLAGAEHERRVLLLAPAHLGGAAVRAVGGDVEEHVVPPLRVESERPAASVLDVVGMRADRQHFHVVMVLKGLCEP